jgi:hypothetical protein
VTDPGERQCRRVVKLSKRHGPLVVDFSAQVWWATSEVVDSGVGRVAATIVALGVRLHGERLVPAAKLEGGGR